MASKKRKTTAKQAAPEVVIPEMPQMTAEEAQAAAAMALGQAPTRQAATGKPQTAPAAPLPPAPSEMSAAAQMALGQAQDVGALTGQTAVEERQAGKQETPAGGVTSTPGSTTRKLPTSMEWLDIAKAEYGWIASLYETDDSIRALLDWASKNIDPTTTEGQSRFLLELKKTAWWNNTTESFRDYTKQKASPEWPKTLQAQTDFVRGQAQALGVVLSDDDLTALAEESIKNGWKTEFQYQRAIGGQYLLVEKRRQSQQEPQRPGQPTPAETDITTSQQFARIKGIAYDLLLDNIPDSEIADYARNVITGGSTEDAVRRNLKARAKLRYSSLSDYIDQDYNLRTVTNDYRKTAATILEKPESEIDFTNETYASAFNMTDPTTGQKKQMNLNEWSKYLRKLPDWQNTQNAQDAYRNMALSIVRGFGKVV